MAMWRSGLEDDERRRPLQKQTVEAEVEQLRRRFPAVMVLCFLAVLLLQRWQAGASPQLPCELERPAVAEGDRDLQDDMSDDLSPSPQIEYDRLLGGLLIEGFEEKSCRSRYQFARYHNSPSIPYPYLIERLRKQEALQKKCGPGTKAYKEASKQLRSGQSINVTGCNYLLLIIHAGLGNRMLEITSAFLYALLTNRILLVDRYKEIADLFCEPFPGTSWLVPSDFPLNYGEFTQNSPESYGNMLQNKVVGGSTDRSLAGSGTTPPYVYLYLDGNYDFHDKLFFCEEDQQFLQSVPWLIMRTDMYFVPSLFLIPAFQDELSRLFPEKDTVFHHLARYLFHPTNNIWYTVTKYYRSYLAKAEKRVAIQIRIYETKGILQKNGPFPHILNQILSCAQNEKLLPEISTMTDGATAESQNNRTVAVLTTSLSSWYRDQIQKKYDEHTTVDGTTVNVYQPSHEEYQRSKNKKHNMKALAEIYLLSMGDVLITSGFSTFGYAAQGLAGLRPWIMYRSENHMVPDPPCVRAMSIEPCFHQAPYYDCKAKRDTDLGKVVPYVRHCEDVSWGLKIQRKPKVGCGGDSAAPEIPASPRIAVARHSWPEAEGAPDHSPVTRKKKLALDQKRWSTVVNVVLVAFVMVVPPVVVVYGGSGVAPAVWIAAAKAQLRRGAGDGSGSFPYARSPPDRLLGGLLPDGLDERSCRSRYESSMYRRNPSRKPPPRLVAKLRKHEELQRRCGPNTDAYSRAVQQLRAGESAAEPPECKYVVSISYRGLGNRILAAASAFLYAVLTDRALLVDPSNEMDELFCEPFPGTTWLLPRDFPLASHFNNFTIDTAESYGNMLKNKVFRTDDAPAGTTTTQPPPAFAYLHLDHDYGDEDKMFFCDADQRALSRVQWLVMRTDLYTVPGLFLVTAFQEELGALFPEAERDAVFHHLARYLFHPSNHVWGLVTRYYRAYLARADLRVGIQVRNFDPRQAQSPLVLHQITSCVWTHKLLPEVLAAAAAATEELEHAVPVPGAKSTAVLITSLRSWYYERIKGLYWDRATATGEDVGVHQPSHEGQQQFGKRSHDGRAWAEMYLLSLCDVLVTSGWSTFGYVAQGLGGVRPWVLHKPANLTSVPDPPCFRDASMEPCFHSPHVYDCKLKRGADTGKMVPHVRHCEDISWGLKLVDPKHSTSTDDA
ncbi:hypothetical protein U9M48_021814 [Paspalum notatum var. saurae]|uniref:Fucosyltransferase n=1 Tax=Paspalum notatum var. saurae TaxID=547442 RepID=A0AAQ3THH2_PASNO